MNYKFNWNDMVGQVRFDSQLPTVIYDLLHRLGVCSTWHGFCSNSFGKEFYQFYRSRVNSKRSWLNWLGIKDLWTCGVIVGLVNQLAHSVALYSFVKRAHSFICISFIVAWTSFRCRSPYKLCRWSSLFLSLCVLSLLAKIQFLLQVVCG